MSLRGYSKGSGRLAVVALLLLLAVAPASAAASGPRFEKCMWVVRFALTDPAAVRRIVDRAFLNGFTTLLVQVRGRGDAWYSGSVEPRPVALAGGDFDPLAYLAEYARFYDIEVHAWINTLLVWNRNGLPRDDGHMLSRHPGWMMHDRRGRSLAVYSRSMFDAQLMEGVFVSPALPEVREYTAGIVRDLLSRYRLDGIHLDYVRYPSPDFDFHPDAVARFRAHYGFDPAGTLTPEQEGSWQAWRLEQLTGLVAQVRAVCREASPEAVFSVAVKPDPREARVRFGQDWAAWCREGVVDAVMPMTYTENAHAFREQVAEIRAAAGTVPVYAGIGAYKQPAFASCQKMYGAALRGDIRGISLFSYNYAAQEDGYLPAFGACRFDAVQKR